MVNHGVRVNSIQGSNWYSDSQTPLVRHFRPDYFLSYGLSLVLLS